MLKKLGIFLCIGVLLAPVYALAQFTAPVLPNSNASNIELFPRFPEPGDNVSLSLNDFSLNTNGATIAWFINGAPQPALANLRQIEIRAGALGETTVITARTNLATGANVEANVAITPVRTDILIEANTLTPSFYAGRPIPTSGSEVKVTVLPFTADSLDPSQYSYTWTVGNSIVGGGSQKGRNSVTFRSGFEREMAVKVDIYTITGGLLTSKNILVPISKPELHFYEVNPLRGLLPRALDNDYIFVGSEIVVRAEPYFFDRTVSADNLLLEWELNNRQIANPNEDPLEIVLRRQGDQGRFTIGFHIRNLRQLLQGTENTTQINL